MSDWSACAAGSACGSIAHFEDVHEDDGPHPGIPRLSGSLDRIDPSGAAEDVRPGVHVNVDGPLEQLSGQVERTAFRQEHHPLRGAPGARCKLNRPPGRAERGITNRP
jgi:hypothetical protein